MASNLLKSQVDSYTRKNGTFVQGYNTKIQKKFKVLSAKPKKQPKAWHPKSDEKGKKVPLYEPDHDTPWENWHYAGDYVTVTPGSPVPSDLNGVSFRSWKDHPRSAEGWNRVEGQRRLHEPEFKKIKGKHQSVGAVIEEADGRVWLVAPSNAYGNYESTFAKGTIERGINPQATAIKEAYEESGLKIEITGFIADVEKTTSNTRYYRARRVGGSPSDMGWESQAVHLVPKADVRKFLNHPADMPLVEHIE